MLKPRQWQARERWSYSLLFGGFDDRRHHLFL